MLPVPPVLGSLIRAALIWGDGICINPRSVIQVEKKRRPLPDYMEKVQKDINPAMRDILLDWLVEVAEEYKLVSDTLYLTVSYVDRFLSHHSVNRNKLQLLGVSCMLIASYAIKPCLM